MKFALLKRNLLFFTLMSFYASCGREDIFDDHNSFEKSFDSVTVSDNYAVYSAINSFEQAEIFRSDLKRV